MKKMLREPTEPGEVLKDIIAEDPKLSQEKLAAQLEVSYQTINQIVNGKRSITADVAFRLGQRFEMAPQFWLNMQNAVDLYHAEKAYEAAHA